MSQMIKNLPAMQETEVWSLELERSPEKGMATHSSVLAWRIPRTEEPGGLQSMGVAEWKDITYLPSPFLFSEMSLYGSVRTTVKKNRHICLFMWLRRVLLAAGGILAVSLWLSDCIALPPEPGRSVTVAQGLSCSMACGIFVPQPEFKPVSPALRKAYS